MTIIGTNQAGNTIVEVTPAELQLLKTPPDTNSLQAIRRLKGLRDAIEAALAGPADPKP